MARAYALAAQKALKADALLARIVGAGAAVPGRLATDVSEPKAPSAASAAA